MLMKCFYFFPPPPGGIKYYKLSSPSCLHHPDLHSEHIVWTEIVLSAELSENINRHNPLTNCWSDVVINNSYEKLIRDFIIHRWDEYPMANQNIPQKEIIIHASWYITIANTLHYFYGFIVKVQTCISSSWDKESCYIIQGYTI